MSSSLLLLLLLGATGPPIGHSARKRSAEILGVNATADIEDASASSGRMVVLVAAAATARRHHRRHNVAGPNNVHTEPPMWTREPVGCSRYQNQGLCEVTLLQSICQAKYPTLKQNTAADACHRLWKGDPKNQPKHMYCLAMAEDPRIKEAADELVGLAPEDQAKCNFQSLVQFWELGQDTEYEKARERVFHASVLHRGDLSKSTKQGVSGTCKRLNQEEPAGLQTGFCQSESKAGQDCTFYYRIREGWSSDYGKAECEALRPSPGAWRCLALRKLLIRRAQAKSSLSSAYFVKFDNIIRTAGQSCPDVPDDAPEEPTKDEIMDLEDGELAALQEEDDMEEA